MTWSGFATTLGLVCDPDLDAPPVPPTTSGSFLGHSVWNPQTIAGVSAWLNLPIGPNQDFSIEAVVFMKPNWDDGGADDEAYLMGLTGGDNLGSLGDTWGFRWVRRFGTERRVDGRAAGNTIFDDLTNGGGLVAGAWNHVVLNFDRDALMAGFRNTVAFTGAASADISALAGNDLSGLICVPMIANTSSRAEFDSVSNDPAGIQLPYIFLGGFAVHSRLLTTPEIAANSAAKAVGQYAETLVRYGPWEVFEPVTGTNPTVGNSVQCSLGCKYEVPAPYLSEMTTWDSGQSVAYIRDQSGNNRHFVCEAQESYDENVLSERAVFATTSTGPS